MDLADQIINAGPYVAGGVMPFPVAPGGHPLITAVEINALRDELIAGRKAREGRGQFEVFGDMNADGSWLELSCTRCPWHAEIEDPTDLAELNQRADEHTEVCR